MRRSSLNFIIDFIAFIDLLLLASTGLIIEYVLPPGTGGLGRELTGGRGREEIKDLLGLTRHQWGDIHYILALAFILLMLAHILLHWTWIKNYFASIFRSKSGDSA